MLQETRRKLRPTYAPADNGNVTLAGHICLLTSISAHQRPVFTRIQSVSPLSTTGLDRSSLSRQRAPATCGARHSATRHRVRKPDRRPPGSRSTLSRGSPATPDTLHRTPFPRHATLSRHRCRRGAAQMKTRWRNLERYAKLPVVILLHRADLRLPRSSILKAKGFA